MRYSEKFLSLSLPWRISISLLMVFLAGPALVGFLSEYATYLYAINNSVRPPVEGIPYLKATVTLVSLVLALAVSLTFFVSRIIIGYLVGNAITSFEGYAHLPSMVMNLLKRKFALDLATVEEVFAGVSNAPSEVKKLSPKKVLIASLLIGGIAFSIAYWHFQSGEDENALEGALFLSAYAIVVFLTIWRKFVMQLVAAITAIAFYVFSISLLFDQDYYSMFLNKTGFGGGQSIVIHLKEGESPIDMSLILRSRDWFIGRSLATDKGMEVPHHAVKSVEYK